MRSIPFKSPSTPSPQETTPTLNQPTFQQSVVTDLSKEIQRPTTTPPSPLKGEQTAEQPETPEVKPETPAAEPTTNNQQQTTTSSATLSPEMREKVDAVKNALNKELTTTIADPKRAARHALHIINLVRFFAYPWLYKKILFTDTEIQQIEAAQKHKAAVIGEGKEEFKPNALEKEMLEKWDFFQRQAKKVSWSEQEIELIAEVGYAQLAEIKFIQWMMKNEWVIVILIIEGPRWAPVAGYKMGFGEMDMGGLTSILKGI